VIIRFLKILLPVAVVGLSGLGAWTMIQARPAVQPRSIEAVAPLIRVLKVQPGELKLHVSAQGTVTPRTESTLSAEVSGRVVHVAPAVLSGGFFEAGTVLFRLDPRDHELAVTRAEAQVAQAEVRLTREQAEAELARQEWQGVGRGEPSPLALREPQVAEARAALGAAQAALEGARLGLERTRISAPYAGRVRQKLADLGQLVGPGVPVVRVYATDVAEVRLPLPVEQLAYLDLSLLPPGGGRTPKAPAVRLRAELAGATHEWTGRIAYTDAEIDAKSRMLGLVAEVRDPYGRGAAAAGVPLTVGLFVEAEIEGRTVPDVAVLPRSALRPDGRVLVVEEGRLRFREVEVLRAEREAVVVSAGLRAGELVCISPLETVVDGMSVRIAGETPGL
jgi:membrane fusion protein, multidrug efflux system